MNFDEACEKAREIAEKYRKEIERELDEQFVSGGVASIMLYELSSSIDKVRHYLQTNELCSQGQFLKALEIILRNRAKSAGEQLDIFAKMPEAPDGNDDKDA